MSSFLLVQQSSSDPSQHFASSILALQVILPVPRAWFTNQRYASRQRLFFQFCVTFALDPYIVPTDQLLGVLAWWFCFTRSFFSLAPFLSAAQSWFNPSGTKLPSGLFFSSFVEHIRFSRWSHFWSAVQSGFGILRRAELIALKLSDIKIFPDRMEVIQNTTPSHTWWLLQVAATSIALFILCASFWRFWPAQK